MRRPAALLWLALLLAVGPPAAHAAFFDPATATTTFTTDTLAPPGALTALGQCGPLQYEVALSWTPTPSTWADGYEVQMATSEAGPFTVVPLPAGGDPLATSRVVGGLLASTRYWFRVTATHGGWRSSHVSADATTPAVCLI